MLGNSSESKRTVHDDALDATVISGLSEDDALDDRIRKKARSDDDAFDDRITKKARSLFSDARNQKRLPPGMSVEEFIRWLSEFSACRRGDLIDPDDKRCMQRKARCSPDDNFYIDAAFRSTRDNEVFMFTGYDYFVVKYDVDSRKEKYVSKSPLLLIDGFHRLYDTPFHTAGVDAALVVMVLKKHFSFRGP